MSEAKVLYSPKQEVAEKQLVELQTAITKIKELIVSGASNEEIQKVINDYAMRYKDKATQMAIIKSLTNSTNKMLYQYKYNNNVIAQTFIQQTVKSFKLGTGTTLKDKTYTIDLKAIYGEYLNGTIGQRECVDRFRNTLNNAKKGLPLIDNYNKLVRQQVDLLASEPVKYVDKNGRAISLRNKVEMAVRYQANMTDLADFKNTGVRLVWCSSHADASPRCSKWQGKLYSLDGTSGTIDGISYEPIENALNDNGGNSIINGYNCRHYLIEYKKGSASPTNYTSKEIQKEYRIDQKQRQYENQIRQLKTQEALLRKQGLLEETKEYRRKYIALNKSYQAYSIKNGRAYYPDRTRISTEEIDYILTEKPQIEITKGLAQREIPNTNVIVVEANPPQPTHKTVNGNNIVTTWKPNKEKFKFEIQDVINKQEFDGLPQVVSNIEFEEKLKKSPLILKRVYSATNQDILEAYKHELREGEWYVDCSEGGSKYGRGMYCVSSNTITEEQLKLVDSEIAMYKRGNEQSGSIYSQIETMCLDENSKIINYKFIDTEYGLTILKNRDLDIATKALVEKAEEYYHVRSDFIKARNEYANGVGTEENLNRLRQQMRLLRDQSYGSITVQDVYNQAVSIGSNVNLDQGVKATLLGYDAITVEGASTTRDSIDYTIILNRTKLIIKGDN